MKKSLEYSAFFSTFTAQWVMSIITLTLLFSGSLVQASPGTLIWDGTTSISGGTDGNNSWTTAATPADWYNGTTTSAWVQGSDASIGQAATTAKFSVKLATSVTVGNITFNAEGSGGNYTISGTGVTITMQGDSSVNGGNPTITQNNATGNPIGKNVVIACGGLTFTKNGNGSLILSSSTITSTANPAVEIISGELQLSKVDNLIPTAGVLQIDNVPAVNVTNAVFDINGQNQTVAGLTSGNTGNPVGGQVNDGGGVTTLTIAGSGNYTYDGKLIGNLALAITGGGTENLTGTNPNVYTNATTLSGGSTLNVVSGGTCSNSSFTIGSGCVLGVALSTANDEWICSNLTFSAGTTTLNLNYNNTAPSSGIAPVSCEGSPVTPNGKITANATCNINVSGILSASLTQGNSYPLVAYSGADPSPTAFHLTFSQGGITGHITTGGGLVSMVIDTYCPGVNIVLSPSSPLAAGTAGTAYAGSSISASGDGSSYTFAVTGGSLPPGITLNSNGSWSGTCTAAGTYNFTVTATETTDANGCTGVQDYSLTINPAALVKYAVTAAATQTQYAVFTVGITGQDTYGNTVTSDTSPVTVSGNNGSGITFLGGSSVTLTNGAAVILAQDPVAEAVTITATDGTYSGSTNITVNAATTLYWDPDSARTTGTDDNGNWDTTSTPWANTNTPIDEAWVANDNASIGTSTGNAKYTIKLLANVTVGSITFNQMDGGSYQLASIATVTLNSGLIVDNNTNSTFGSGVGADKFGHGGTLNCGALTFTKDGAGAFQFSSDAIVTSTAAVGIEIKDGELQLESGTTANVLPTGILQVDSSSIGQPLFEIGGYNLTFVGLQSGGSGTKNAEVDNNVLATPAVVTLNGSGSYTFAGVISGNMGLTLSGSGTEILTGNNTYTNATTVSSGTLLVNGGFQSTNIAVSSGATFGGTGTLAAATNCQVNYNAGSHASFTVTLNSGTNSTLMTMSTNIIATSGTIPDVHLTLPNNLPNGTYTLATYQVTGSSGSFASTPVIDSGSFASCGTGYSHQIVTSGGVVSLVTVYPGSLSTPTAAPASYTAPAGVPLKIFISDLLTNTSESACVPLTLVGVGTGGGGYDKTTALGYTLFTNAAYVYYTNNATEGQSDSFTYIVSDPDGNLASSTVSITITNGLSGQGTSVAVSGSTATVQFAGIPSESYEVERATNLVTPVWVVLETTNAPSNGLFQVIDNFSDLGVVPSMAYYRLYIP